jgi:hypothetical protein
MNVSSTGTLVKTYRIKKWARVNLPVNSSLRQVLLLERDELGAEEFINKIDVWLKLLDLEASSTE